MLQHTFVLLLELVPKYPLHLFSPNHKQHETPLLCCWRPLHVDTDRSCLTRFHCWWLL